MILLPRYRVPQLKPPTGVVLNAFHPLAQGLRICVTLADIHGSNAAGDFYTNYADAGNPAKLGNAGNGLTVSDTSGERGLNTTATGWLELLQTPPVNGLNTCTFYVRASQPTSTSNFQNVFICSNNSNAQDTGIFVQQSTTQWGFQCSTPSNVFITTPSVAGVQDVVGTYDGVTERLFINGVQQVTGAQSGAIESTMTKMKMMGSSVGSTEFGGIFICGMLWTRTLSPTEVMQLTISPYQMFYSSGKALFASGAGGSSSAHMRKTSAITGTRVGSRQMVRTF